MKNLILIRHSKSSWDSPLNDKERPLANKGMTDAHLVSTKIIKHLPETFIIWSSTAKRAMQTAIIFVQNIGCSEENIIFKEELYTFDSLQLEKIVKSCDNSHDSLILFGHNEAITDFVNKFGDYYVDNVPTSGFVHLKFKSEQWENIEKGKIKRLVIPKDLK